MAGVKTFDLLVGVVVVLQCVGSVRAEITASNGKNQHLKPEPDLLRPSSGPFLNASCTKCFVLSDTGGVRFAFAREFAQTASFVVA